MKKIYPLLLIILTTGFQACAPSEIASLPPEVQITNTLNGQQTLKYTSMIDSLGNTHITLDTIAVGDTAKFGMMLQGFYHNLTSFYITGLDTIYVKSYIPSVKALYTIFSETKSDYTNRSFVFLDEIKSTPFSFLFIAKKANPNLAINLIINSKVTFEDKFLTNTDTVKIKMVIK